MSVESSNCKIRIATNNLLKNYGTLSYPMITVSSEDPTYVFENALNDKKFSYFKFVNHFEIADVKNIYINDGADKTVLIGTGSYTGTVLASTIQTALNSASSGFTVTYTSNRFTISRTSTFKMRFSVMALSLWDELGYTSTVDTFGTSFIADERRNHDFEYIDIDLGAPLPIEFIGMVPPTATEFGFSDNANIRIKANNILDFETPVLDELLTVNDDGAFIVLDNIASTFRYWRIYFQDRLNPDYNPKLSNIYLGQYLELSVNVEAGFGFEIEDQTRRAESESGVFYHDIKNKAYVYNFSFNVLSKDDLKRILDMTSELGLYTPFYFSLDYHLQITTDIRPFTKFIYLNDSPSFSHVFYNRYAVRLSLREAL